MEGHPYFLLLTVPHPPPATISSFSNPYPLHLPNTTGISPTPLESSTIMSLMGSCHSFLTGRPLWPSPLPSLASSQTTFLRNEWFFFSSLTWKPRTAPHFTSRRVKPPQHGLIIISCMTWPLPTLPLSPFCILVIVSLLWILWILQDPSWSLSEVFLKGRLSPSFQNHEQTLKHTDNYSESENMHPGTHHSEWTKKK